MEDPGETTDPHQEERERSDTNNANPKNRERQPGTRSSHCEPLLLFFGDQPTPRALAGKQFLGLRAPRGKFRKCPVLQRQWRTRAKQPTLTKKREKGQTPTMLTPKTGRDNPARGAAIANPSFSSSVTNQHRAHSPENSFWALEHQGVSSESAQSSRDNGGPGRNNRPSPRRERKVRHQQC